MAAPPRVLSEEVIGEILFRLPPDHPACLFRASAVCKSWRAFLADPAMLRLYRELHAAPPVLCFLQNTGRADNPFAHIIPTAAPSPPLRPPDFQCWLSLVLDCRHGRVLLHTINPLGLLVWNPVTGSHHVLPDQTGHPEPPFSHFTGAVLCAKEGCGHLNCGGGPFRVVFAATVDQDVDAVFTWASLYSSETGAWTEPATVHPGALMNSSDVMGPSLLAGDALYFTLDLLNNRTVLRYDLGGGALSVKDPPPLVSRDTFLVTREDGGLGVAAVEGYSLHIWSWKAAGAGGWAPPRVIDLEMSIPFTIGDPVTELKVIGFAEMSGIIFVSANGGISSVDLRSGRVSKFSKTPESNIIFPFEIFYTLGMQGT
ncbi:unnamed protein product [Urochloa decumbens]|uniref:F-box domain-containing protein n=1 Tax=Urochloa decumbens TaxID=240449 RepID=A0ABC9E011_9POAL